MRPGGHFRVRVGRGRARRVGGPAALLALLAVIASPAAGATRRDIALAPDANSVLAELVQDVGGRGASQSPERYAYLRKLDGRLQVVAASGLGTGGPASAAVSAVRQGITMSPGGEVPVDVYVTDDVPAAAGALRALGMRVTGTSDLPPQRMVEGFLPAALLPAAAALARRARDPRARSRISARGASSRRVTARSTARRRAPSARGVPA